MCLRLGTAWFGGGDGGDAVQELEEGGESNTLGVTSKQSRNGKEGEGGDVYIVSWGRIITIFIFLFI